LQPCAAPFILSKKFSKITNMKRVIFTFGILFVFGYTALAQATFKAVASNGNVVLKSTNKRVWAGTELKDNDVVVVPAGAYLGLVHLKSSKSTELKQAGSYKIGDLAAKMNTGNASTTSKYVNYVVGEMAKADQEDINKNHRKYMAVTGSVERAMTGYVSAYAKDVNNLFDNKFFLRLMPADTVASRYTTYYITVKDLSDKEVAKYVVQKDFIEIDFSKFSTSLGATWVIILDTPDENSEKMKSLGLSSITVSLAEIEESEKFKSLQEALKDMDNETAIDKLLRARVFEEKEFYLDAVRAYEEAIALAPGVDTYKIAYNDFLVRTSLIPGLRINENLSAEELKKAEK